MPKESEAKYAARREEEELLLAMSSPSPSVSNAHFSLAVEYRLRRMAAEKNLAAK